MNAIKLHFFTDLINGIAKQDELILAYLHYVKRDVRAEDRLMKAALSSLKEEARKMTERYKEYLLDNQGKKPAEVLRQWMEVTHYEPTPHEREALECAALLPNLVDEYIKVFSQGKIGEHELRTMKTIVQSLLDWKDLLTLLETDLSQKGNTMLQTRD